MEQAISPKASPLKRYVITALVIVVVLAAFNLTKRAPTTGLQYEYAQWLEGVDPALKPTANVSDLPSITVTISLKGVPPEGPWVLKTGKASPGDINRDARDKMYRILHLIQESGVFGVPSLPPNHTDPAAMSVTVDSGDRRFVVTLPGDAVAKNIQAQNLVKLSQLYATMQTTPVAVTGQL